jgi:hypothetical protein
MSFAGRDGDWRFWLFMSHEGRYHLEFSLGTAPNWDIDPNP